MNEMQYISAGRYYYQSHEPERDDTANVTALPTMPEIAWWFSSSTNVQRTDRQMMASYLVKYNTGIVKSAFF